MDYKYERQLKIEMPCRISEYSHPVGVMKLKNHCCPDKYVLILAEPIYANARKFKYSAACSCGSRSAGYEDTPDEAVKKWIDAYDRQTEEEMRIRISELNEEYAEAVFEDPMLVEEEDPLVFDDDEGEEMTVDKWEARYERGDD